MYREMASRKTKCNRMERPFVDEIAAMGIGDPPSLPLDKEEPDKLRVTAVEATDEGVIYGRLLRQGRKIGSYENLRDTYKYGQEEKVQAGELTLLEDQVMQGVTGPSLTGVRVEPAKAENWEEGREAGKEGNDETGTKEVRGKTLQGNETIMNQKEVVKMKKGQKVKTEIKEEKSTKTISQKNLGKIHHEGKGENEVEKQHCSKTNDVDTKETRKVEKRQKGKKESNKRKLSKTNKNVDPNELKSEQEFNKRLVEVKATPWPVACHLDQLQQDTTQNSEQHEGTSHSCGSKPTGTNSMSEVSPGMKIHAIIMFILTIFVIDFLVDLILDKCL